jgi:hypothetical protein
VYEVRIYDGEGRLLRTVQPGDAAPTTSKWAKKFEVHDCPGCGESTSKKKYCYQCILNRQAKQNGMKTL